MAEGEGKDGGERENKEALGGTIFFGEQKNFSDEIYQRLMILI
jgi:hypothetical protein